MQLDHGGSRRAHWRRWRRRAGATGGGQRLPPLLELLGLMHLLADSPTLCPGDPAAGWRPPLQPCWVLRCCLVPPPTWRRRPAPADVWAAALASAPGVRPQRERPGGAGCLQRHAASWGGVACGWPARGRGALLQYRDAPCPLPDSLGGLDCLPDMLAQVPELRANMHGQQSGRRRQSANAPVVLVQAGPVHHPRPEQRHRDLPACGRLILPLLPSWRLTCGRDSLTGHGHRLLVVRLLAARSHATAPWSAFSLVQLPPPCAYPAPAVWRLGLWRLGHAHVPRLRHRRVPGVQPVHRVLPHGKLWCGAAYRCRVASHPRLQLSPCTAP